MLLRKFALFEVLYCSLYFRTPVPGMETHIPVIFLDLNGKLGGTFGRLLSE